MSIGILGKKLGMAQIYNDQASGGGHGDPAGRAL
jgi:hypothetical protein